MAELKFFIIFWYFFGTNDSATLQIGIGLEKKQILRVDTNEWKRRGCGTGAKLGGNVFRGSGKANGMVSHGVVWNGVVCNSVIWYVWYGMV